MSPQTISIELKTEYRHFARSLDRPMVLTDSFESFEAMMAHYCKERRRRSLADRATHATYRQVLTAHGQEMVNGPDDHYSIKRYWDAIYGTQFEL